MRQVIEEGLVASRRPPDGMLHPSSHLVGSLRHVQLELAGAPMLPRDTAEELKLLTGTLIHDWMAHQNLSQGVAVMQELKMQDWMPRGWSGRPDGFYWLDKYQAFALADYKTMKPEGIPWVARDGVKEAHLWQTSMYYHAAVNRGFPMVKRAVVGYLPKDQSSKPGERVDVTLVDFEPLPKDLVWGEAERRLECVTRYVASVEHARLDRIAGPEPSRGPLSYTSEDFLTDVLEPVQDRVPKLVWDKARCVWNVVLQPHWSARYCPFSDELCGCRNQGQTKIGEWSLSKTDDYLTVFYARQKVVAGTTLPQPDKREIDKRRGEIERHAKA